MVAKPLGIPGRDWSLAMPADTASLVSKRVRSLLGTKIISLTYSIDKVVTNNYT